MCVLAPLETCVPVCSLFVWVSPLDVLTRWLFEQGLLCRVECVVVSKVDLCEGVGRCVPLNLMCS